MSEPRARLALKPVVESGKPLTVPVVVVGVTFTTAASYVPVARRLWTSGVLSCSKVAPAKVKAAGTARSSSCSTEKRAGRRVAALVRLRIMEVHPVEVRRGEHERSGNAYASRLPTGAPVPGVLPEAGRRP